MPKRKRSQQPPPASPSPESAKSHKGTRHATVYDAVASRVNYEGFVYPRIAQSAFGANYMRSQRPRTADEVLGRRRNAPDEPIPYGEAAKTSGLPDSDLLIAVHQYAADFYGANGMGPVSYRSLDETALLAVEETVRTCLGENGDLVLIEQEEESNDDAAKERPVEQIKRSKTRAPNHKGSDKDGDE